MSSIITLTSDWGTDDYFVAAFKGQLLRFVPSATVIDISHHINPFDIMHAAYILRNSYKFFADNTIHLIGVDCIRVKTVDAAGNFPRRIVAVEKNNQIFIGPDSGLFNNLFTDGYDYAYEMISYRELNRLKLNEFFISCCYKLLRGEKLIEIGNITDSLMISYPRTPSRTGDGIAGHVEFIDRFGNAITNISQRFFEENCNEREFELFINSKISINKFSQYYDEEETGEVVAMWNSSGVLELALNTGRMDKLIGLKKDSTIRIVFK
ncbi:MAG: SAM-dependent chlorinase/fluorinase [Bacteroidetes bacterium]|nr:SAM-dependent chlorinase/fluorinase [Bacteroidota bacterium]